MIILIVDDYANNRRALRAILEAEGLEVVDAADGVEALAVLRRENVDAVISDILMPRMDGYRLCLELRQSAEFCRLPFIIYTSTYTSTTDENAALQLGADEFLKKPSSAAEILQALRQAIEKAPRRRPQADRPAQELDLIKEYNQRLVDKLEKRNLELQLRTEELQKSESAKRAILESALDAIIAIDHEGKIVEFNPAAVETFGFTREEALGREMAELIIPPALREPHRRGLERARTSGVGAVFGKRLEMTAVRRDGTEFPVELTITPMGGADPPMYTGFVRDITRRKRAHEALLDSRQRLQLIFDNNPLPTWVFDHETLNFIEVNEAAIKEYGYSRDEFLQMRIRDIRLEEDGRKLHEYFAAPSPENSYAGGRHRRKDGEIIDVEIRSRRLEFAGRDAWLVVAANVTERKQAEYRLATHHAVIRVLAESAGVPETSKKILRTICQSLQWDVGEIWMVDRASDVLRCIEVWHAPSTASAEFLDVSRQMTFARGVGLPGRVWANGQAAWISDVTMDPNFPRAESASRMSLHTGFAFPIHLDAEVAGVLEFFSVAIRRPDNDLMTMLSALGTSIGSFLVRKQLEGRLRQSQKMEAFGQLAGGVAHDFNNILAVIMGYTDLLMEDQDVNVGVKEQLKQVYSAGERAANLTRQMLTFSRKKEMTVGALDLNAVIGNMTKMLGRIIGEDIKLQCIFSPNLPTIQADEGMMEQVLMNLAVNARDAMPNGGRLIIGTDRIIADAAYVRSNPEARAGEFVCLTMQDAGCGMTPEVKARIFEPFFTTKDVGKGTGLGLATVYGIVRQHQGWIEVESQAGVGAIFKVFLPASPQPVAGRDPAVVRDGVRGGRETILLVEDEAALRGLAKVSLERYGYRVLEAASGVEALSIWEKQGSQVDLLLTDMVMPEGVTGRELAKQLQALKPALKVIYTSGYSMDSNGTNFRLRETAPFLQKPYHPQKLAQAVRECLDN